jgi:uncharacterized protein (TIGR00297 family)
MHFRLDPETVRKWLHLAPGLLAFGVRDLGVLGSLALVVGLLVFNLWMFPRLGAAQLWRPEEREQGEAAGILLYPLALLILAVACRGRLEVLAGGWGMLAFGDAAATLAGRRWGRRELPWNTSKSWLGTWAFMAASWVAAVVLVEWTAPGRYSLGLLLGAAGVAAAVGAVVESLPWALDDNVSVTVLGGGALYVALSGIDAVARAPSGLATSAAVAVGLAAAAFWVGAFDRGATLAALAVAVGVGFGAGWRGLLLLALFAAAGTVASRRRRRVRGEARPEAPRLARNVLANGVAACCCGLLAGWQPSGSFVAALVGALAVAAADTVGGEIGLAWAGRTWRVTDGRAVEPGANGGVSWAGLAATVASSAAIAALAVVLGLLPIGVGIVVAVVGVAGALLDSILGATVEQGGLLDNESVNLSSTLAGAWLAALTVDLWTG